jgi:hypothetical protein
VQSRALVSALPTGSAGKLPFFNRFGIILAAPHAGETFPLNFETVRVKIGGKKLETLLFVVEFLLNNAVFVRRARAVQCTLKIFIVAVNLMPA